MCHSCSVIQGFVTARDWLAYKHSKGDVAGTFPTAKGHVDCPAPFGMQLWTHVSGKIIGSVVRYGLLRREFPLRIRIGIHLISKSERWMGLN
jgi:hypothetical protein